MVDARYRDDPEYMKRQATAKRRRRADAHTGPSIP